MTKYDPTLRVRGRGGFTGDDWTEVSDVGKAFDGQVLTLETYLDVEARHLQVVAAFLDEAELDGTVAHGCERPDGRWWPVEGQRLSPLETVDVVREMLRGDGYCRLEGARRTYIHVGWDYYMYLGGDAPLELTMASARRVGLFADTDFTSPYHIDPATGQHF